MCQHSIVSVCQHSIVSVVGKEYNSEILSSHIHIVNVVGARRCYTEMDKLKDDLDKESHQKMQVLPFGFIIRPFSKDVCLIKADHRIWLPFLWPVTLQQSCVAV